MTDVEGVRNLHRHRPGRVRRRPAHRRHRARRPAPHQPAHDRPRAWSSSLAFALVLSKAFSTIRPIFRERGKINAEVTGRLTESLGGVRVVKGYHAEAREEAVFAGGVQRLLDNVLQSLTAISLMSLSATVLMGIVGARGHVRRARARSSPARSPWAASSPSPRSWLPGRAGLPGGGHRHADHRGAGRARAHAEVLRERPEDEDPRRTVTLGRIDGDVVFDDVSFAYEAGKPVLHDVSFRGRARHGDRAGRPVGLGQVDHHQPDRRVPHARPRAQSWWTAWTSPPCGSTPTARSWAWCCRRPSCSTAPSARTSRSPGPTPPRSRSCEACRIARVDEFAEHFEKKYDTHRRRARRQALRRPAPARFHRARHPRRSAHPDPRRSHVQPRFRVRGADPGRPRVPDEGPHHVRDRAPALHHPPRRPDPGGRGRPHRRARHARIALRPRRAATSISTPASTASRPNLFLAPGEGDETPEAQEREARMTGPAAPTAASLLRGGIA